MKPHIFVCTEINTSWQILSLVNKSGGRVVLFYYIPHHQSRKENVLEPKRRTPSTKNNITTDHFEKQRVIMHIITQTLNACWKQKTSEENRADKPTGEIAIP